VSDSKRSATGGELVALWVFLALWITGFAGETVTFARQWRAIDTADVSAFSANWLTLLTALLLLAAWVLAIVLAVRLRRWGWLVACVLLFVAVPVFAIAMLIDGRTTAADRQQQASFDEAMARALAEEQAGRSQGGM
jgi:ABC-type transport system involved in cytochrome c biogenesis permease subunit